MGKPFGARIQTKALRLFAQGMGARAVEAALRKDIGESIPERTLREWWQRQRKTWTVEALVREGVPEDKSLEVLSLYHVGHAFMSKPFKPSDTVRQRAAALLPRFAPLFGLDRDRLKAVLKSDTFPWEKGVEQFGILLTDTAAALRRILGKFPDVPLDPALQIAFVRGYRPPQKGPDMQCLTFVADRWEEYKPWRSETSQRAFALAVAAELDALRRTHVLDRAPGLQESLEEWTARLAGPLAHEG